MQANCLQFRLPCGCGGTPHRLRHSSATLSCRMCSRPPTLQQSACPTIIGAPQPSQSCSMLSGRRLFLSRRLSQNSSAENELPLRHSGITKSQSPDCSSGQDVPTFDGRFVNAPCINELMLVPQAFYTAVQALVNHTFTVVF